jgi:hypothetical protein
MTLVYHLQKHLTGKNEAKLECYQTIMKNTDGREINFLKSQSIHCLLTRPALQRTSFAHGVELSPYMPGARLKLHSPEKQCEKWPGSSLISQLVLTVGECLIS